MTQVDLYKGLEIDRRIRDYMNAVALLSNDDVNVFEALKVAGQSSGMSVKYFSDPEHKVLVEGIKNLLKSEIERLSKEFDSI